MVGTESGNLEPHGGSGKRIEWREQGLQELSQFQATGSSEDGVQSQAALHGQGSLCAAARFQAVGEWIRPQEGARGGGGGHAEGQRSREWVQRPRVLGGHSD